MTRNLVYAAAAIISGCSAIASQDATTASQLQAQLSSDLPVGTDATKVIGYLNEMGYTDGHSYSEQDLIDNAGQAHLGADPATFGLKAIIRKTKKSALVSTDMAMTFTFDRDRKLTVIDVKEVHTGL
jgi:hypothetical protein